MTMERVFLGWDRPLVAAVADHVCAGRVSRPLDLADTLIVVPTQQAARRLREFLALRAAGAGSGLWSPRVTVPAGLLPLPPRPMAATPLEMEAVWLDLLRRVRLADYPALFPVAPAVRDTAWALPLARALRRLRATLAEAGLLVRDVAGGKGAASVEADRWDDLARLESKFLLRLEQLGRSDPVCATLAAAKEPRLPDGIARLVVAGVPDLAPLHQGALAVLAEKRPVFVLIAAPAERADAFDEWGRPRPEVWAKASIDCPCDELNLALCAGPAGQARRVAAWMEEAAARFDASHVAVGVPDPEVIAPLTALLAERGLRAYDPGGRPVREHPVAQLLEAAAALATAGDYAAFRALARHAGLLDAVAAAQGIAPPDVLRQLDEFQNRFLPTSFAEIARKLEGAEPGAEMGALARVVEAASRFLADVARQPAETALRELLREVYANRTIRPDQPGGEAFIEVGRLVGDELAELGRLVLDGRPLPADDFFALLLARLREECWYPERADAALELEGWMELPWNDAPFVILTGVNEGLLPEGQLADLFLPDSLRAQLGLRDDAARAARDAFLLTSLLESRRAGGRVAIALGRASAAGDPLKPSRLLFRCEEGALADRCRRLFGEVHDVRLRPAVTVPFLLRPGQVANPPALTHLRVTSFRSYLACPFRFYLSQVLGMEGVDDRKVELDARDFGTLIHHALQKLAGSPAWRACADARELGDFLAAEAEAEAIRRYGKHPSLPVVFQVESAQQRLRAAARVHAASVAEGWEIIAAEHLIEGEVGGYRIRGRVDRIERHGGRGILRVLDYKSSDQADTPVAAHLAGVREDAPAYARVSAGGRDRCWKDLQLPLYRMLLRHDPLFAGAAEVELGYFNLPKAVGDTGICLWEDFTPELDEAARRCAEGVGADLAANRFWPPRDAQRYDDFERIFPGRTADFVEPRPEWPQGGGAG